MKKEQFDESVNRALYQASRNLELNETLRYLEKNVNETERKANKDKNKGTAVYSTFELKTNATHPGNMPKAMILRSDKNSLTETQKSLQEIVKNRYVYQKALLDEVVYSILYSASDKPLKERINFKQLDQDLKAEMMNNGINIPYHFTVTTQDGREVYRCPDYTDEGEEYSYSQVLFRNDPQSKMGVVRVHFPDMNSYNLYFGWYLGELEQNDSFFDAYHNTYPDRVIGLSEYGADANPAYHSANPERGDYTEEYQCIYHEHMAKMIGERPYLWATHVWNLFDFAADGRDEGGKHGVNQKGLVTIDRKLKKDAFYLYKAYWSKTPFVHVCGRRYVDRTEDVTEIKVYSNEQSVTLFVDGVERETAEGSKVFKFEVPITETHKIRAVSGACEDEITVKKVEKSNPDYIFNKQGDVVNWFDRDDFKADHYSISDTLGELAQNEMANAIVQRLMAQASASRGDVAESVKDNPALQRMMQRMTLVSLLKQAGDAVSEEQMKADIQEKEQKTHEYF